MLIRFIFGKGFLNKRTAIIGSLVGFATSSIVTSFFVYVCMAIGRMH
jgi:hypothetical protein